MNKLINKIKPIFNDLCKKIFYIKKLNNNIYKFYFIYNL